MTKIIFININIYESLWYNKDNPIVEINYRKVDNYFTTKI